MPVIPPSQLLQALGWSLINSLWQMALLWALYMLLSGAGKGFSARARHLMALVFTMTGSVWFALSFLTRLFNPELADSKMVINLAVSPENSLLNLFRDARQMINGMVPYLTFAYLGTISWLFAKYLHYYRHLEHLKSTGLHKIQGNLRIFCAATAKQMGIQKKISVWLSSAIDSPVTIGFLKPVILIPIATVTNLSPEQVESILLHELTHINRNDYLINLLLTINGNIFFFNPFSRLLIAAIKEEREHCCDDLVLQFQYNPHTYASALLSLERTRHDRQPFALAAVGRNNRLLLERVKRVTGHPLPPRRYSASLICCLLLATFMGISVFVQPRTVAAVRTMSASSPKHPGEGPGMILGNVFSSIPSRQEIAKNAGKLAKSKSHKMNASPRLDSEAPGAELTLVSNEDDGGEQTEVDQATAAVESENRVYSIAPSPSMALVEAPVKVTSPYVPSSSFSYKIMIDTLPPTERFSYNELRAKETMERTLQALDEIDWKEIQKQVMANDKKVNFDKLQELINQSLRQLDWDKINRDVQLNLSQTEQRKIDRDIRLQLETLKRLETRNSQQALRLRTNINEDQLRLQRLRMRNQVQTIRKAEEMIRRKYKVVYI